jgi:predicted acylesterase/phospholipase RssA
MPFSRLPKIPIAALLLAIVLSCAATRAAPRTCFALVLSGGGARGLAQIGTIKALEEQGLRPNAVIGTSMGAIIGSLYAAGYSADSILQFAKSLDWNAVYANTAPRADLLVSQKEADGNYLFEMRFSKNFGMLLPRSISDGQVFYAALGPRLASAQYRTSGNFDSLPIPLRIVSTNLLTGSKMVFSQGDLLTAVRASCGFPLIFSPLVLDSMLLADGGLLSNLPVETGREQFPGYAVVAVDVTSPLWGKQDLENPVRLMDQVVNIGLTKQKAEERSLASVVVTPNLLGFRNTDFSDIDALVERGYAATMVRIDAIRAAVSRSSEKPQAGLCSPSAVLARPPQFAGVPAVLLPDLAKASAGITTSQEFREAVYGVMTRKGYPFVQIRTKTMSDSGIVAEITPGKVRNIVITGNNITRLLTIKSMLGVKIGDTLTTRLISKAISALYASQLFKTVEVVPDSSGAIKVSLTEKEFLRMRLGLRFDEYHLLEGYVQPAYENLFGLGITGLLHAQYGLTRQKYALELEQSHVFSRAFANVAQIQGFVSSERVETAQTSRDSADSVITYVKLSQQTLVKGGVLALVGMELGKSLMLEAGFRAEKFSVYESAGLQNPFGGFEHGLQYLMLRLTSDNLDRFPFPENGQKTYFTIGGAHDVVTGTESFVKIDGGTEPFFTFGRIHTFSPQLQFSWSTTSLPPVEKVYVGGTVQEEQYKDIDIYNYLPFFGLQQRTWPGDIAFLLRGNYRLQIKQGLYVLCSIDWGYAWSWDERWAADRLASGSIGDVAKEFVSKAPLGIGLGVAYATPVGPIRFFWGRLLTNPNPELNILSQNLFYLSAGHDF